MQGKASAAKPSFSDIFSLNDNLPQRKTRKSNVILLKPDHSSTLAEASREAA